MNGVKNIFSSTKWVVALGAIIVAGAVTIWGPLSAQEFVDTLKWVAGIAIGARALEDGLSGRKKNDG